MKTCTVCGSDKPIDAFCKNSKGRQGRHSQCNECREAAKKLYRAGNRDKIRDYNIRYYYGISSEEYDRKHKDAGQCPICGFSGKLHLDHNHSTGQIRDFLCPNCNTALGLLNEDPERMERMIAYVRKHERRVFE